MKKHFYMFALMFNIFFAACGMPREKMKLEILQNTGGGKILSFEAKRNINHKMEATSVSCSSANRLMWAYAVFNPLGRLTKIIKSDYGDCGFKPFFYESPVIKEENIK